MKKSWLKKLNRPILKKKTPIFDFTVLQLLVLFVIINGGVAAVAVNRYQPPAPAQETSSSKPVAAKPQSNAATPATAKTQQNVSQPATTSSVNSAETTVSTADRCQKLSYEQLRDDIENFQRDIDYMRKNLATVDTNASLLTVEQNNAYRNQYIKLYNDSRTGSVNVYKQTMVSNGCSSYMKEPSPGYVEYF